jgi:uracil-DNA glycosylase
MRPATLLCVGEAPNVDDELAGVPLAGACGALLDKIINAIGITPEAAHITTLCKHRPQVEGNDRRFPDRPPTHAEMASFRDMFVKEVATVQPRVIMVLGPIALAGLCGPDAAMATWLDFQGVPLIATSHPGHLLWFTAHEPIEAKAEKQKVWDVVLQIKERLAS